MREFESVQRVDLIKQLCAGKRVLHLGCTNYPYTQDAIDAGVLLHFDLERIAAEVCGIDADRAGIDILNAQGSKNLIQCDLESLNGCAVGAPFDVILAGEVIEHLNNPGLFLNGLKRFMREDTELVVTTVNAYCAMRFFHYGARGKGGRAEPTHPDHVAHYSYSTLKRLLERHGFDVEHFYFYDLGNEHRRFVPWYLKVVNDVSVALIPQWSDGVIARCRLKAAA